MTSEYAPPPLNSEDVVLRAQWALREVQSEHRQSRPVSSGEA